MRTIISLIILFSFQEILAESIIRVEDSPNNICNPQCMYDEWLISEAPEIRFVIAGYEDGTIRNFYKIEEDGTYTLLLEIHPIIKDKNGMYWWGYAKSIEDLVYTKTADGLLVMATFNHDQCDDGNHPHPDWQKQVPVVLFKGEKVDWNIEQPEYEYREMSLSELKSEAAKANKSHQPTACGGG